jgi:hypothetical protein
VQPCGQVCYYNVNYCLQGAQGAWYHGEACRAVDAELARLAAAGLMPIQAQPDAAPGMAPAWQIIRGTAVSAPQVKSTHLSQNLLTLVHIYSAKRQCVRQQAYVEFSTSKLVSAPNCK